MTDESAKALADAMNRLASAIKRVSSTAGGLCSGIQVWHHGQPAYQQNIQPNWSGMGGGSRGYGGNG